MIEVKEVDLTAFNAGLRGLVGVLNLHPKDVVRVESTRLLTMLIRVTPPKDIQKTKKVIANQIGNKFQLAERARSGGELSEDRGSFFGNFIRGNAEARGMSSSTFGAGKTGIEWFGVTPQTLYGVTKEADRRNDSVDELQRLSYTLTGKGRRTYGFSKGSHNQNIRIISDVLTNPATVTKLIRRLQKHVGRLKAGWTVAFKPLQAMGAKMPSLPKYVKDNMEGARGGYVNEINTPGFPSFTMINKAKGASSRSMDFWMNVALQGRAAAMKKNLELMFAGKKSIGDYAK